jgi:Mg2+-importing ATPase
LPLSGAGRDSRDLDQLTVAEALPGDAVRIRIAVADVDALVQDGSAIDAHARHNTFLPMLPIQVLTNNLLYDFSQTTIPTDAVDADWLTKPRQWTIGEIQRFILCIGPISSIFDYLTFFIMLRVFDAWHNPALFHTGWFVESLFTQTLIIHVIRTHKIPFVQSRASGPLIASSLIIVASGPWLTVSPLADTLGFVPLPPRYWLLLAIMLVCYVC